MKLPKFGYVNNVTFAPISPPGTEYTIFYNAKIDLIGSNGTTITITYARLNAYELDCLIAEIKENATKIQTTYSSGYPVQFELED